MTLFLPKDPAPDTPDAVKKWQALSADEREEVLLLIEIERSMHVVRWGHCWAPEAIPVQLRRERVLRTALAALKALEPVCDHGTTFDEAAAKGLDVYEVRKRWPRFSGTCEKCGYNGICYASYLHYLSGDW